MLELKTSKGISFYISDEDFERVTRYKWNVKLFRTDEYVYRNTWYGGKRITILLHRFITDCPKGKQVHHKNFNPLDNTRENLEVCTQQQNLRYNYCGG